MLSTALVGFVLNVIPSSAQEPKAKEVTLEGTATCAKCDLGTEKECTNVLQVKEGEKTVTYYLAGKADKVWHKQVCTAPMKAKLTGTMAEKEGKKTLTVTKVDKMTKIEKAEKPAEKAVEKAVDKAAAAVKAPAPKPLVKAPEKN